MLVGQSHVGQKPRGFMVSVPHVGPASQAWGRRSFNLLIRTLTLLQEPLVYRVHIHSAEGGEREREREDRERERHRDRETETQRQRETERWREREREREGEREMDREIGRASCRERVSSPV